MIVISLSTVPAKLRGYLSIYLWEIDTNVFVGNVSARVRDLLWERVEELVAGHGRAIMVYPSNSEQGFDFRTCGTSFSIVDFEGLKLVMRPTEKTMASSIKPYEIKKVPRNSYRESYVVLDLETTGTNVENDSIIEIGAVKVINREIKETYHCIIKTEVTIPQNITELTGITQALSNEGVPFSDAILGLKAFMDGLCVIGYNIANFDARILHHECVRNAVEYPFMKMIDVLPVARQAIQGLSSYSLKSVATALNITIEDTHHALSDCHLCHAIYSKIYAN